MKEKTMVVSFQSFRFACGGTKKLDLTSFSGRVLTRYTCTMKGKTDYSLAQTGCHLVKLKEIF